VLAVGARVGLSTSFSKVAGQTVPLLPASERFFAGGDNTVRGFDQDQLGAGNVLDENGVSSGGNALVVLNAELRFPLLSRIGLGGATFVDVGNVYQLVDVIELSQMRTGLGFGIRWRSPVGPLRIDLGWKTTQHTFGNGQKEPRFSPYIQIGQAF
jgi:outer membrane translocation and assembly module TamA